VVVSLIPFLVIVFAFWLASENEELSTWLFPPHLNAGWYLDERDSGGAMVPLIFGSFVAGWSIRRLLIDMWPAASEFFITSPLRRGTVEAMHVRSLLRALLRDVKSGAITAADPFDPKSYLRARYRRVSRAFYAITLALLVPGAFVEWRGLASYTLIDNHGFEDIRFFNGQRVFHRYQDATMVLRKCDWRENQMFYDVVFRDQDRVSIFLNWESFRKRVPALLQIDENLRRAGVEFGPAVSVQPTKLTGPECVRALARRNGVEADLVRVMHPD
jgi:hypothetical protein